MGFDFSAPWWLLFLLVVVGLAAGYAHAQLRRRKNALRFGNLDLLNRIAPAQSGIRRHLPMALILVGLLLLTVALAGPMTDQKVPRNRATVILVVDVSLSMEAEDVQPTRLAAAQEAGRNFADGLTPGINLGLIAFAGTASVLVSPTTDREATKNAIDNLQLAERTATGEAIFAAIQSIETLASVIGGGEDAPPARIVLLSDGKQTVPANEDDPRGGYTAAREAAAKGIPVSTISFGTPYGSVVIQEADGPPQQVQVPVDDPSLREIANLSGGSFFTASSLEELNDVYDTLEEQIGYEVVRGDSSGPWLIAGVLFIAAGAATAVGTRQRLP